MWPPASDDRGGRSFPPYASVPLGYASAATGGANRLSIGVCQDRSCAVQRSPRYPRTGVPPEWGTHLGGQLSARCKIRLVDIRRVEPTEAQTLAEIAHRAIRISASPWYSHEELEQWTNAFSEVSMRNAIENSAVFGAIASDRIAGFANLVTSANGRSELDLLFVDPDFAGRGVARTLIAAVEEEAASVGVGEIWVDASIPAKSVFERLGYQVQQTHLKEFGAQHYENTWLSKRLGA